MRLGVFHLFLPVAYRDAGRGQCTTEARLRTLDVNDALLSSAGHYTDWYDSEAKCRAKCDADVACFAYSWKVSYTDCKTYNRLDEVVVFLGVKSAGGILGHDATCYVQSQFAIAPAPGTPLTLALALSPSDTPLDSPAPSPSPGK